MKIYIKYMVSNRCKVLVKCELEKLGIPYINIELGEVEIEGNIDSYQLQKLNHALMISGLELREDRKSVIVKQIKSSIHERIFNRNKFEEGNITDQICKIVNYHYAYIAHIFFEMEGQTIKHYITTQKIKRVKELIIRDHLTITEIAYRLNYSSVAHLSTQFKKITGLSPKTYMFQHSDEGYVRNNQYSNI